MPYDASKPTLVMINGFGTTVDLFTHQFSSQQLRDTMNMLAIEPLGHGSTRTPAEHYTYWDTAQMNLQVLDALNIPGKVFVLGSSQGGWMTAQMALLAPDRVAGIIPIGTSMDSESERSQRLGCWNAQAALSAPINNWASQSAQGTPDFEPDDEVIETQIATGFGKECSREDHDFWRRTMKAHWKGDDGRRRGRMSCINLRDRDSLHGRLADVRCPVMWLHGTADSDYSVANAEEEIEMFVNSPHRELRTLKDGTHYVTWSKTDEVNAAVLEFVKRFGA